MSEYLRKDAGLTSEPAILADASSTETNSQRTLERDSNPHTLITPPPTNDSPANLASDSGTGTAVARAREEERVALFAANESNELRARWDSIQVGFVDEPRKAVQEADALVSATIKRLAEMFAAERQKLEQQWDRSENISTEDFRVALRRYRSFFARLLAI
ncbi:MAG TPA: hypothetical protein VN902_21500 [Candidatus Acidoferrales bacterium]|nr:hypothetical protein [Candidatus Acidoferrales bacterium]